MEVIYSSWVIGEHFTLHFGEWVSFLLIFQENVHVGMYDLNVLVQNSFEFFLVYDFIKSVVHISLFKGLQEFK
jgi:hypothetical protein